MKPRATSLLLLSIPLLALACRSVPATLTLDEQSEPVRTPEVFVEDTKTPAGDADPRLMTPVSEDIVSLYSCWFESPYEYMFAYADSGLQVNGRAYGVFMAGISGILYYGDFNTCAGRLAGVSPRSYSDFAPIAALAGIPVTHHDPSLPFDSVNPEIVAWARATLLPPPGQFIEGIVVQEVYDRVFHRFFQAMAVSLIYLHQDRVLADEAQAYLRDVQRGANGIDWLENHYGPHLPALGGSWDGTTMTTPMAAGFWLRRELDGSGAACWHGLRDVLERYDRQWLDDLLAKNPQAAAILSALPDPVGGAN